MKQPVQQSVTEQQLTRISGLPGSGKSLALMDLAVTLAADKSVSILALNPANQRQLRQVLGITDKNLSLANQIVIIDRFWEDCLRRFDTRMGDLHVLTDFQAELLMKATALSVAEKRFPAEHPFLSALEHGGYARELYRLYQSGLSLEKLETTEGFENLQLAQQVLEMFLRNIHSKGYLTQREIPQRLLALFQADPFARSCFARDYPVLLIDEAQELSRDYYQLLEHLAPYIQIILCGSPAYCLRLARGAWPQGFENATALDIPLKKSLSPILPMLDQWHQKHQLPALNLDSAVSAKASESVSFGLLKNSQEEVAFIINQLQELKQTRNWKDMAILLRSARSSDAYYRMLTDALTTADIPFQAHETPAMVLAFQTRLFQGLSLFFHLGKSRDASLNSTQQRAHQTQFNNQLIAFLKSLPDFENTPWLITEIHQRREELSGLYILNANGFKQWSQWIESTLNDLLTSGSLYALSWKIIEKSGMLSDTNAAPYWSGIARFLQQLPVLESNLSRENSNPCDTLNLLEEILAQPERLWKDPWQFDDNDAVRILDFYHLQGESYAITFLPFLTSQTVPVVNTPTQLFTQAEARFLGVVHDSASAMREEMLLFSLAASRGKETIIFSTHNNHEGKEVSASAFYTQLFQIKKTHTGQTAEDFKTTEILPVTSKISDKNEISPWQALEKETDEALFIPADTLTLSPSHITTYMYCPRRYFYQHLLDIPDPNKSETAAFGLIFHHVLEQFNKQFKDTGSAAAGYTTAELLAIAQQCFDLDALDLDPDIRKLLMQFSPMQRDELQRKLMASIEDLEAKGYFQMAFAKLLPEQKLTMSWPEKEQVKLKGFLDLLAQKSDGSWVILDYKTYSQSRFSVQQAKRIEHLKKVFNRIPADAPDHATRFENAKGECYQIPLYYFLANQNEDYRGKISEAGLQLLRPAFGSDNGSVAITLTKSEIEACLPDLQADLESFIINPILEGTELAHNPDAKTCPDCTYFSVCDVGPKIWEISND